MKEEKHDNLVTANKENQMLILLGDILGESHISIALFETVEFMN